MQNINSLEFCWKWLTALISGTPARFPPDSLCEAPNCQACTDFIKTLNAAAEEQWLLLPSPALGSSAPSLSWLRPNAGVGRCSHEHRSVKAAASGRYLSKSFLLYTCSSPNMTRFHHKLPLHYLTNCLFQTYVHLTTYVESLNWKSFLLRQQQKTSVYPSVAWQTEAPDPTACNSSCPFT